MLLETLVCSEGQSSTGKAGSMGTVDVPQGQVEGLQIGRQTKGAVEVQRFVGGALEVLF